jgi:hypothetical protein
MSRSPQRRDQRRRLLVAWTRKAAVTETDQPTGTLRQAAHYSPEADPEKHRGPAVLLPTGLGGLTLAALAVLLPLTAAVTIGGWESATGRALWTFDGRFARTLTLLQSCFDPASPGSLQAWLAQTYLLLAAGIALVVRLMRRHRRDDYRGRYRAWTWLAAVLLLTSMAGSAPVGPLMAAAVVDATGIAAGPGGAGWWFALATVSLAIVSAWAVLPLYERACTLVWLTTCLAMWSLSAAASWVAATDAQQAAVAVVTARAAWTLGAGLALVTMLAAARSVIREVRGLAGRRATAGGATPSSGQREKAAPREKPAAGTGGVREPPVSTEAPEVDEEAEITAFIDGSESEQRHLSKAERKRLKKLARMRAAA